MFDKELLSFLLKVITSWQVIAVTVVLILYFTLVSYVARMYHPRSSNIFFESRQKKGKARKPKVELPESSDDDLGLEEQ